MVGVGGEWGGTGDNSQVSNSGALLGVVVSWASAVRAVGVGRGENRDGEQAPEGGNSTVVSAQPS